MVTKSSRKGFDLAPIACLWRRNKVDRVLEDPAALKTHAGECLLPLRPSRYLEMDREAWRGFPARKWFREDAKGNASARQDSQSRRYKQGIQIR